MYYRILSTKSQVLWDDFWGFLGYNEGVKDKKIKIAVGLSGGVDSAVSAYLLKKAGYEVTGVHLVCWDEGPHCKAREDRQDALKVALALDIPFEVLDFQKEYKKRVIDRFYADYEKGLTPNPDVWCNSEIKFGMFLEWAVKKGFDYVATGHYAKVENGEQNLEVDTYRLMVPKDEQKDQTYFLYQLGQAELKRVMFPLGGLLKSEVREMAKEAKLPVANKKDSQGICFVGDVDIQEFLRRRLDEKPGEVVNVEREVVGRHKGVWFYTIGERGGWEVDKKYQKKFFGEIPVFYVIDKEVENNRLVVGFGAQGYRPSFMVGEQSWTGDKPDWVGDIRVRIRHGGELLRVLVSEPDGKLQVQLESPQRGVSSGQAAVFYRVKGTKSDKNEEIECIGGGVIA